MVVTHADPPADLPYEERPLHIYYFYLSFYMYLCLGYIVLMTCMEYCTDVSTINSGCNFLWFCLFLLIPDRVFQERGESMFLVRIKPTMKLWLLTLREFLHILACLLNSCCIDWNLLQILHHKSRCT